MRMRRGRGRGREEFWRYQQRTSQWLYRNKGIFALSGCHKQEQTLRRMELSDWVKLSYRDAPSKQSRSSQFYAQKKEKLHFFFFFLNSHAQQLLKSDISYSSCQHLRFSLFVSATRYFSSSQFIFILTLLIFTRIAQIPVIKRFLPREAGVGCFSLPIKKLHCTTYWKVIRLPGLEMQWTALPDFDPPFPQLHKPSAVKGDDKLLLQPSQDLKMWAPPIQRTLINQACRVRWSRQMSSTPRRNDSTSLQSTLHWVLGGYMIPWELQMNLTRHGCSSNGTLLMAFSCLEYRLSECRGWNGRSRLSSLSFSFTRRPTCSWCFESR